MKIQASSIYRILECAASAKLAHTIPDEYAYSPFKDAATFGKDAHEIAERVLKGEKKTIAALLKEYGYIKGSFNYERGLNAIAMYKKHANTYIKVHDKLPGKTKVIIEKKFRYDYEGLDFVFKSDFMLVSMDKDIAYIDIMDLKTGNFDYVKSAMEQLLMSAHVYIATQFKKPRLEYHVRCHVVQPNYYNDPEKIVTEEFTIYDAEEYFQGIKSFIDRGQYNCGDHCIMCPGILNCSALQISVNHINKLAEQAGISEISDIELETLFYIKRPLEAFLNAVEMVLEKRIKEGYASDKVYIRESSGKRYWKDAKQTERKLKHLGDKRYAPRVILSPAQMEKLAGKENIVDLWEKPSLFKLAIRENPFKDK